jgi:hypothetical protein|tara:strand:- start:1426 stop:1761 length:336 start_codon:yes stop_codon:yes gene_type:complete
MAKSTKKIVGAGNSKGPRNKKQMPRKMSKQLAPMTKEYNKLLPDSNGLVGAGVTGLGKNEMQRRVKQHLALAEKAYASGNTQRASFLRNRADAMKVLSDYTKIGDSYYPNK